MYYFALRSRVTAHSTSLQLLLSAKTVLLVSWMKKNQETLLIPSASVQVAACRRLSSAASPSSKPVVILGMHPPPPFCVSLRLPSASCGPRGLVSKEELQLWRSSCLPYVDIFRGAFCLPDTSGPPRSSGAISVWNGSGFLIWDILSAPPPYSYHDNDMISFFS